MMEIENQTDQAIIFLDHSNVNSFRELIKDQRNVRMHIDDYSQYKAQFIASVLQEQTQMEQYGLLIDAHSLGCADTKAILKAISCLSRLSELDLQLLNVREDSEMTEILQICQSLSLTLKKLRFLFYHIEINQQGCEDLKIALSQLQNVSKLCIDVSTLKEQYDQNLGIIRAKSIGEGLSTLNSLESLELSIAGTNIGSKGGELLEQNLVKILLQNQNLKKLKINVHSNQLGDIPIAKITKSIAENARRLTQLYLNFSINNLTNQGLFQMGKIFTVYQKLKFLELDLMRNDFDEQGLSQFFGALTINSLERLKVSISRVKFNLDVVQQVRNLISNNRSLSILDIQLSNCTMDNQSQLFLAKIVIENSFQIRKFILSGIQLQFWYQYLRPCIEQCLHQINDLANVGLFFSFLCSPEMHYHPNFIFCDLYL
ncbi:hypothetical protein TTHERM_00474940 (macronuclear) [Tetrahymena thermophila SB210]|uniref:Kinase domain protein n=1 Tax=Tetrahymena thermophila (strain SB210) TaxID=312017 RepID=I7MHX8_TETTS|nr:hypothetical protein TTHERM_00474940 [Tetrahymena thermophila SB210]EAS03731.2 hypothetical protein TTHERM_00474940 [Tetrahymena thermophila SB210]|eukprot:XP_001023976.2 hypothetical protein TTHERM_00474940 [Tetrahymena thermophila SB210]